MGIISMCFGCSGSGVNDAKLADPKMTLENNPYAEKADPLRPLKEMNERRLYRDAKLRGCPVRGQAYSAIMDTRWKGE